MAKKIAKKVFEVGFICGIIAFLAVMIIEVCGFVLYPQSYFTTHPDFTPLETAAPVLWQVIVVLFTLFIIAALVCVCARYIYIKAAKKHR